MKNKNILLVGGCGFIGHNLALKLVEKNYNVSIVDSLAVNNLLSFTDNSIVNKNLYRSILNNRIKYYRIIARSISVKTCTAIIAR